jgi:mannose-6-phosphate isomerase-like protein (cupin superfamily)
MVTEGMELLNTRTGQRLRFIDTALLSGGTLVGMECVSRPGPEREPEHIHPHQENIFEIHSGSLRFKVGGVERAVGPGERLVIPPGVPHCFWVEGAEETRYRQEFRPALHIERFFEVLFALARDGQLDARGMPPVLMLGLFGQEFWDEVRVTQPPAWVQRCAFAVLAPLGRVLGYRFIASATRQDASS